MSLKFFKKKDQDVKIKNEKLYSRIYTLENGEELKASRVNDLVQCC
jgi:hypothetical protein